MLSSTEAERAPQPASDGGGAGLDRDQLDRAILAAHAAGDLERLAALYAEAGMRDAAAGRADSACFFWTQAWIFALDAGAEALAAGLEARLREAGRQGPGAPVPAQARASPRGDVRP